MITNEQDRTKLLNWWSTQGTPFSLTINGLRYHLDICAKQNDPEVAFSPLEQLFLVLISQGKNTKAENSMNASISFFQDGSFQINDTSPDYVVPNPILPVIFRELYKRYCQAMVQI